MSWFRRTKARKDYRITVKTGDPTEPNRHVVAIEHLAGDFDFTFWSNYRTVDCVTQWVCSDEMLNETLARACKQVAFLRQRDDARNNTRVVTC